MLQTNWQIYDHYGYALIAVIGTLAVAVAIQWLIQWSRWAPWTRSLQGVAPPFINIIGVLFALTLAFLANDTWSAHDRAMKAVYQEANALHGIATLSAQLPEPLRGLLRETWRRMPWPAPRNGRSWRDARPAPRWSTGRMRSSSCWPALKSGRRRVGTCRPCCSAKPMRSATSAINASR
jgi:hypothetical protein